MKSCAIHGLSVVWSSRWMVGTLGMICDCCVIRIHGCRLEKGKGKTVRQSWAPPGGGGVFGHPLRVGFFFFFKPLLVTIAIVLTYYLYIYIGNIVLGNNDIVYRYMIVLLPIYIKGLNNTSHS